MDTKKALEVVAKLHQEKAMYHTKRIKAKRWTLISLIMGLPCLVTFIVMIILASKDYYSTSKLVIAIIFGIFAFIFLELAIILYTLNRCVYIRQEENRQKLLTYIEKEVNGNKK